MKQTLSLLVLLLMLISQGHAFAADDHRVGRYASLSPVATAEQRDVLGVVVTVDFASQINTVGEALHHLLLRTGYRLAALSASDPAMTKLMNLPLPYVHRSLGPIRVDSALEVLAGPAWWLVIDPVNRLVSFELKDEFRS